MTAFYSNGSLQMYATKGGHFCLFLKRWCTAHGGAFKWGKFPVCFSTCLQKKVVKVRAAAKMNTYKRTKRHIKFYCPVTLQREVQSNGNQLVT